MSTTPATVEGAAQKQRWLGGKICGAVLRQDLLDLLAVVPAAVWQAHGVDGAALQQQVAALQADLDANADGFAESLSFALVFTSHRLAP